MTTSDKGINRGEGFDRNLLPGTCTSTYLLLVMLCPIVRKTALEMTQGAQCDAHLFSSTHWITSHYFRTYTEEGKKQKIREI